MNPEYWIARWHRNEIGFHAQEFQTGLTSYWDVLNIPPGKTVLVPLCGKTRDLLWLAGAGYRVIGIEVSEKACVDFFDENEIEFQKHAFPGGFRFEADEIILFCADFFALKTVNEPISAVYDRASLVALPRQMRAKYVAQIQKLAPQASCLLISFDYGNREDLGPPFSIPEEQVRGLFNRYYQIELLEKRNLDTGAQSKMAKNGINVITEEIWHLSEKKPSF